jgi:hypothetical protein
LAEDGDKVPGVVKKVVKIWIPEKRLFDVLVKDGSSVEKLHWDSFYLVSIIPPILRIHSIINRVSYVILVIDGVVKQHNEDVQGCS